MVVQFPAVGHHDLEILVTVDAGTNESVVVLEFGQSDVAIRDVPEVAILFESLHEVSHDGLACLLPTLVVRMSLHIIQLHDVVHIKHSVLVDVYFLEHLLYHSHSEVVHRPSDHHNKLVVINGARPVSVEKTEELFIFRLC